MTPYFGNISSREMNLSESGQIAKNKWNELPEHFAFVSLDEFIIMPDHVHGIIMINPKSVLNDVGTLHATSLPQNHGTSLSLNHATSLHNKNEFLSSISPKPGSLATVIRSYKSAVSKDVHMFDSGFSWQPRYYDHLIHSDIELDRIRNYIIDNPANWM
jgi:REP element-mobilizing transposase RayT